MDHLVTDAGVYLVSKFEEATDLTKFRSEMVSTIFLIIVVLLSAPLILLELARAQIAVYSGCKLLGPSLLHLLCNSPPKKEQREDRRNGFVQCLAELPEGNRI